MVNIPVVDGFVSVLIVSETVELIFWDSLINFVVDVVASKELAIASGCPVIIRNERIWIKSKHEDVMEIRTTFHHNEENYKDDDDHKNNLDPPK